MKVRRTLSGILFGAGCAFTFIGLLALLLPCVENAQLQLVLASFDLHSDHPVVSLMNRGMSYALHNGWQVLFAGLILLAVGLILLLIFTREPKRYGRREYASPPPSPAYVPQWEQPAPSEPESNPFASAALWEHQFAPAKKQESEKENPFTVFGGPMLEPNRIDSEPTPAFVPESYTRPEEERIPFARPVEEKAPITEPAKPTAAESAPEHKITVPPADEDAKPEPVYTPNEEPDEPIMISSRIRSTMGRRREW